jgi:hypothetical protein
MAIQRSYERAGGPTGSRPQLSEKVPAEFRISSRKVKEVKKSVPAMRPAKKRKKKGGSK